jgi:hypothetical protein
MFQFGEFHTVCQHLVQINVTVRRTPVGRVDELRREELPNGGIWPDGMPDGGKAGGGWWEEGRRSSGNRPSDWRGVVPAAIEQRGEGEGDL